MENLNIKCNIMKCDIRTVFDQMVDIEITNTDETKMFT